MKNQTHNLTTVDIQRDFANALGARTYPAYWIEFDEEPDAVAGDVAALMLDGEVFGYVVVCAVDTFIKNKWILHWEGGSFEFVN